MIKRIRAIEWMEGPKGSRFTRWGIQVMYVGSTKWEAIEFVKLRKPPKEVTK